MSDGSGWGLLTSREWALVAWSVALLCALGWWTLKDANVRRSLASLISAVFRLPQLWLLIAATGVYAGGTVSAAHELGLWHTSSIKETVYWFFGTGIILALTAVTAEEPRALFAKVVRRAIRLTILVEFLVNLYVFPFVVELFLLPIVSFIVLMNTFAHTNSSYLPVRRLTDRALVLTGFTLLGIATARAIADLEGLGERSNVEALLVPPALTLALIPFLAAVALLSAYEQRLVRRRLGFRT